MTEFDWKIPDAVEKRVGLMVLELFNSLEDRGALVDQVDYFKRNLIKEMFANQVIIICRQFKDFQND